MNGSIDKIAMCTMCVQGFQQNRTGLAVKLASYDSTSIKLGTYTVCEVNHYVANFDLLDGFSLVENTMHPS